MSQQYPPPPAYPSPGYPPPGNPPPGYPQPGNPPPGYPQPGYPQPGYPDTQQGFQPPPFQEQQQPPQYGYPQTQQPQGVSFIEPQSENQIHDNPAYPPGSNPAPYFQQSTSIQKSVFSPEFNQQYMADYSSPDAESGVSLTKGFIPPNAVPPNEVTEVNSCVCFPDKSDAGKFYYFRIFTSTLCHLAFFVIVSWIIASVVLGIDIPNGLYAAMGIVYILIFMESLFSYDLRYLREVKNGSNFAEYMAKIHQGLPSLTMYVECFHYENRTRTVYYKDSKGNRKSKKETKRVRVVTHHENEIFEYRESVDMAPPNISVEHKKATRIAFFRTFQFADDNTRKAFELQSMNIRNRNRNRDRHMKYYELFELPGFIERMLAFVDPNANHCCFNPCIFILLSLILCTWPFRWWFRRVTAKTSYTFIKQLRR